MNETDVIKRSVAVSALMALLMAGFVLAYQALTPVQAQPMMGGTMADGPTIPPVRGYAEGQEILFLHTEASAPHVAQLLTEMMGSPVLVVPALAQAPDALLANVYVFQNGTQGSGPFGFQPDVFDSLPGSPGYSPLRRLNLVTWQNEDSARLLTSAAEVQEAQARGELTIEQPGAVINMPLVTWSDGRR